jgi:uracil-DNA glycosylase
MMKTNLHPNWLKHLNVEFEKDYFIQLKKFLKSQHDLQKIIYPKSSEYFFALEKTPLSEVKVVLLGQDPYHGPGQAHGLCFSVQDEVRLPPSLQNIFKELKTELGVEISKTGNLTRWAEQGVLMLNSVLTVEKEKPASHQKQGWETFTDRIISVVNSECKNVVFILWGSYAQKKAAFVNREKHLVIENVHPSLLSSHRGFFGSKPFSKTNAYLREQGKKQINW